MSGLLFWKQTCWQIKNWVFIWHKYLSYWMAIMFEFWFSWGHIFPLFWHLRSILVIKELTPYMQTYNLRRSSISLNVSYTLRNKKFCLNNLDVRISLWTSNICYIFAKSISLMRLFSLQVGSLPINIKVMFTVPWLLHCCGYCFTWCVWPTPNHKQLSILNELKCLHDNDLKGT